MKNFVTYFVAIGLLAITSSALAQAGTTTPPPNATTAQVPRTDARAWMAQMDEQLKKMQAQHARMMSAKTPEERQRWMDEQHKSMQDSMALVTRMMQDSRMDGGMRAGKVGQDGRGASDEAMQMMMKGIELMQMMMLMTMDQLGIAPYGDGMAPATKR